MQIFKRGEWSHLKHFYLVNLIQYSSALMIPFMVVYFRSLGFSFTQISLIVLVLGLTSFLFEVPTGALADGHSRKLSVIIGSFGVAIVFFTLAFVTSFWGVLFLFLLFSFFQTFISGSDSSWVVSNLIKSKKSFLKQEYFIKLEVIVSFGLVISPLIGMFILKHSSYTYLWFFSALGMFISGLILLFVPEHYSPKKTSLKKAFFNMFRQAKKGFKFVLNKKTLFYFFLAEIFVILMTLGDEAWQPLFVKLGGSVYQLGYLYSLTAASTVLVPFLVRKFTKISLKKLLIFSELFDALILLSVFLIKPGMFWYIIIPFVLFSMNESFKKPLKDNYLHTHLKEHVRATVVSLNSMLRSLFVALTGLIGGILLDIFPLKWVIAGGAVFVIGAVYFYGKI